MKHLGVEISVKNQPVLDPSFIPMGLFNEAFLKTAKKPVSVAVERENGQVATVHTFIHGTEEMAQADTYYIDRLVKSILWMKGGFKVFVTDKAIFDYLRAAYTTGGSRQFDADFMANVYENPFQIVLCDEVPAEKGASQAIGRHLGGCRIGFDAGGSDRKVSAVIDGESVYSEEVVWFPKTNADPDYHYEGIVAALKSAAAKMPRVDAVGVSSAGVFVANMTRAASLFLQVPKDLFDAKVKDIYPRAVRDTFGPDVPVVVCNDGDVSALAGAMGLGENSVLGIAMGTSEAVGYVAPDGNLLGWFNELAFAPVDLSESAMQDEWSGDFGVGCKYFSQDAVIKLAPAVGIELDPALSPAEKLKVVQALANANDENALKIYASIGVYLAHTLALYSRFYALKYLLVLGRVASGVGGDLVISECNRVLREEYPELADQLTVMLPDEKTRRVGQSVAAASLPELNK